jgi:hypothetical protein
MRPIDGRGKQGTTRRAEYHGFWEHGTLLDQMSSTAKTNPKYATALKLGRRLLHEARYMGF